MFLQSNVQIFLYKTKSKYHVYSFTEDDQLALDCISPSHLGDFFTGLPYQITVDSSCQKVYM